MKSSRTVISIGYNDRVEVEPGVWENEIFWSEIKAEEEYIFQARLDKALHDGQVLTKRFRVRSYYIKFDLDYVRHKGVEYKVRSIFNNIENHYAIIECGELI